MGISGRINRIAGKIAYRMSDKNRKAHRVASCNRVASNGVEVEVSALWQPYDGGDEFTDLTNFIKFYGELPGKYDMFVIDDLEKYAEYFPEYAPRYNPDDPEGEKNKVDEDGYDLPDEEQDWYWKKENWNAPSYEDVFERCGNPFREGFPGEDMGLSLASEFDYFELHGYSQGDSCFVICRTADGCDKDELHKILFDGEVTCDVVIDGEEFHIDDDAGFDGTWDKEVAIKALKKQLGDKWTDEIAEAVEEAMPEEPAYY